MVSKGILNEVYYPTIDRPQIRDLQYLIADGETFFRDERQLDNAHECLTPGTLGYRITNANSQGGFRIIKEVLADHHQACVLVQTRLEADAGILAKLRLFIWKSAVGATPETGGVQLGESADGAYGRAA